MFRVESGITRGVRRSIVGLLAGVAAFVVATNAADARRHRHQASQSSQQAHVGRHVTHHSIGDGSYSPPYAAIVVDANTGKTLQETNADSLRHPASLTKVMTLYLLFERLDAGKIKLGTLMPVSEHAAAQAPTKLGLRPGQHISVEDAIRGLVTRSANDAAVVIAEAIGGDERTFAEMMTAKARALGMSRTTYVNASGLPDDDQVTTARDQALLGRLIAERFPTYYTYFSTPSFVFRGEEIRNHNHLLGSVQGVDGIKTGYTHASGFNLVTSVRRNGRHIVAVVMGGSSAGARDARMRELIDAHFAEASTHHTLTAVANAAEPASRTPARASQAAAPASTYSLSSASSIPVPGPSTAAAAAAPMLAPATAAAKPRPPIGSSEPIKPIAVKTIKVRLAPVHTAALAPAAAMIPIEESSATPAEPAKPAAAEPAKAAADQPKPAMIEAEPAKTAAASPAAPAQSPSPAELPSNAAPAAAPAAATAFAAVVVPSEPAAPVPVQRVAKVEPAAPPPTRSLHVHSGWIIQIGAFESETEALQHLDAAQSKAKALLRADRFTETVIKGDKTLYRARFAGLEKDQAEATCKQLKRSDIACMALKN